MTIKLTPEKAEKLKNCCQEVISTARPTIRTIAKLLGLMTASFPGVRYGPLYYRRLDREKTRALSMHRDFDRKMTLSLYTKVHIKWWIDSIHTSFNIINHGDPHITLYTDASKIGWGCDCQGIATGGPWSPEEAGKHINYLEMLAIKLALESFENKVSHKHVKLMVDNMTAVTILSNMGSSHSWELNELNIEIWEWCIKREIWLTLAHVPGVNNVIADRESRLKRREIEWTLNQTLFEEGSKRLSVKPQNRLICLTA
ncbi:uncharacterized protein LOC116286930 [Actinia tenebrosa]|uniref:Uncharacterized protein LOC116286930 n=1 Tax=Actinia tenebrosa TaxID=6105 RepID=A0A6P8H1V6_ACTTE|nr:uncharacterized protein LOC116286930 [Actinia tenebrosa]